ncbi:MAG: TolC family protein [Patescibacteria group bacterium]|nr:TolC family protein [Patescibacteria group bacterium]
MVLIMHASPVFSQQLYPVNLETILKLAGANNLTIKEYKLHYDEALAAQNKAQEWWLPNLYAGATAHFLNGPTMNTDGAFFSSNLKTDNFWGGLGVVAEIDFSKGIYNSLAAKQSAEAIQYQGVAERNNAILKVLTTYFDLQTAQLKYQFLQNLVAQADSITQEIQVKMKAGMLYQSDYLMAQSNYKHLKNELLKTKTEWEKQSAALANLVNLQSNVSLFSADTLLLPLKISENIVDTSIYSNGFVKRPEYEGLNCELRSFEIARKTVNQGLFFPKLRISFDNGSLGTYGIASNGTYPFNTAVGASIIWNIPLGRFTYNGDLKKYDSQILLQQNKMEQFKNQFKEEVYIANEQLLSANEQMINAKEALQESTEALNESIQRQKLGTARPFEVFQAQEFNLQSLVDYLESVAEYNKAQYALYIAMGNNL